MPLPCASAWARLPHLRASTQKHAQCPAASPCRTRWPDRPRPGGRAGVDAINVSAYARAQFTGTASPDAPDSAKVECPREFATGIVLPSAFPQYPGLAAGSWMSPLPSAAVGDRSAGWPQAAGLTRLNNNRVSTPPRGAPAFIAVPVSEIFINKASCAGQRTDRPGVTGRFITFAEKPKRMYLSTVGGVWAVARVAAPVRPSRPLVGSACDAWRHSCSLPHWPILRTGRPPDYLVRPPEHPAALEHHSRLAGCRAAA